MSSIHAPADALETALVQAFAPMHKRALGVAVGLTAGAAVFALTVFHLMLPEPQRAGIQLLSHYFVGYTVSWIGACIGAWWGFVTGFVAGWFFAFVRNFSTATWLLVVRVKAELFEVRDFLDHI